MQALLRGSDEVESDLGPYRPRPTDIVISPFAKCGTTWLQQIFHCLRTRGDTDFDDISRVVPWIETAPIVGLDLEAPQRGEPRGFKSHQPYDVIPKGARYIVAFRDPLDALVSMFRFMEGWFIEPGTISMSEFAQSRIAEDTNATDYWSHLISWWGERDNPDVLLLSYEAMTLDAEVSIRRVAAFSGLALDDDLLALTLERSSLRYMLEHKDQFDDLLMREAAERRCHLPRGSDSSKVRKGGVGGHRQELSPEIVAAMNAKWAELVEPKAGFADFAAFDDAVRHALQT